MWSSTFGRDRKCKLDSRFTPVGALATKSGRFTPCELWVDYGVARIAETKLQQPSPLRPLYMQQARA